MSYAIIRNEKYKRENLKGIYRHNERRNKNYSNKNIDKEKSYLNYSLKSPQYSYEKEFEKIRKEYNLKGQIKIVSNIVCEYIITSDKEFFNFIGTEETKRYFETAYKFVCEYKNLGERYILSSTVHMDEETPHMHLVFIPVVHTIDKKGNNIDKIACSEFWKEKDSYRMLQDAFYDYMISNNFKLERGVSERVHLSVEDYKKITGFENTKKTLRNVKITLPKVPDISEFNKLTLNRDKKIQEEIINPKDKLIEQLHKDNIKLYEKLNKQVGIIDEAEKFQNEKDKIVENNKLLEQKCKDIENAYISKFHEIEDECEYKIDLIKSVNNELLKECEMLKENYSKELNIETEKIKKEYFEKIYKLENENNFFKKIISTLENTIEKFIHWVCKKFSISEEDELIRNFEYETDIYIEPEKQIEHEYENELDFEE